MKNSSRTRRITISKKGLKRIRMLAIALIVVTVYGLLLGPVTEVESHMPLNYTEYTVKKGDTIWNIAAKIDTDRDIREVVADIRQLNSGSTGMIYEGDVLCIPVY